jgi:hypothetical protein
MEYFEREKMVYDYINKNINEERKNRLEEINTFINSILNNKPIDEQTNYDTFQQELDKLNRHLTHFLAEIFITSFKIGLKLYDKKITIFITNFKNLEEKFGTKPQLDENCQKIVELIQSTTRFSCCLIEFNSYLGIPTTWQNPNYSSYKEKSTNPYIRNAIEYANSITTMLFSEFKNPYDGIKKESSNIKEKVEKLFHRNRCIEHGSSSDEQFQYDFEKSKLMLLESEYCKFDWTWDIVSFVYKKMKYYETDIDSDDEVSHFLSDHSESFYEYNM